MNPSSPYPPSQPSLPPPMRRKTRLVPVIVITFVVLTVIASLSSVVLPAVRRYREKSDAGSGQTAARAAKEAAMRKPLTTVQRAALMPYGEKLADLVSKGDGKAVSAFTDYEAVADRVFDPMKSMQGMAGARSGFIEAVKKSPAGFMTAVMNQDVRCLRARDRDGMPSLLLRVSHHEGGVNYVELLVRPQGESFRIVDVYTWLFGSYVSDESRRAFAAMTKDWSGLAAIFGVKKFDDKLGEAMSNIGRQIQSGRFKEVIAALDEMSPEHQNTRALFGFRLQALMSLQEDPHYAKLYRAALVKAPELLGEDSATELLMLDLFILDEDYAGADKAMEKLAERIGGDAFLDVLRGNMKIKAGDVEGAEMMMRKAEKVEPELHSLVDLRMLIHAGRKNYSALVDEMRALQKRTGGKVTDKELTDPEYAEFLKSKEFQAWMKE